MPVETEARLQELRSHHSPVEKVLRGAQRPEESSSEDWMGKQQVQVAVMSLSMAGVR